MKINRRMATEKRMLLFLSVAAVVIVPVVTLSPALILTPYLAENRLDEARTLSTVDPKLFLNVTSHSGFFTVDKKYNSNIFFWYFPVANRPVGDTPWIIWLQGGPGASSLVGLFDEMGPFAYDGKLSLRKTSWWNEYSMVFIDNPVGSGFSFTDHMEGLPRDMETYGSHLYSTVQQFLRVFPELRPAPLYIAGSSYAGRYVPALATKITETPDDFNLQGLILGNPALDRESILDYTSVFYQWGLIDQQGALAAKPLQEQYNAAVRNGQSDIAVDLRNKLLDKLQDISHQEDVYNVLSNDDNDLKSFIGLIGTDDVREAIHVGELGFSFSNSSVHKSLVPDFLSKVTPKIEALLEKHPVLIYCGQLDLMAPCVPNAEARRRAWRWSGRGAFLASPRLPWWYENSIAGYVKSGGGLTEVLVRGAGHLAPIDKPAQIQELVSSFIRGHEIAAGYGQGQPDLPDLPDLPELPDLPDTQESNAGLIVSVFINVLLVISIIALLFWFLSWKKRNDALFIPLRDDIFSAA